jgi:purine nucleoside permease
MNRHPQTATGAGERAPSTLLSCLVCAALAMAPGARAADTPSPLPVRVAVLVNFEIGADRNDDPGEFQYWVERGLGEGPLDDCIELPYSTHAACVDRQAGLLVTYTGLSQDRAAASVMALGLDPRFDFSRTYWIIGGIAGIDPDDGTIGSAVWGRYVVNGDWGHEIDAREMPGDWDTGYLPFMRREPWAQPMRDEQRKTYALNPSLATWAFRLTQDIELPDSETAAAMRGDYEGYPSALARPRVLLGDNLSASTFWHGALLNRWANGWVAYWTAGRGEFVTTAVEDGGILEALRFLDSGGRVDFQRIMLLRTASNFSMQPPGMSAAESLTRDSDGFGGLVPAIEAHWRVGSTVAREIADNWNLRARTIPAAADLPAGRYP